MMIKGSAIAIVVSMAIAWSASVLSVSAWSLSPLTNGMRASATMGQSWNYRNSDSETVLRAAPDAPLFSDDLTGRTNHGPNPRHLTVQYKETMLRQAYDEWRAKYGRGDFDTERFRIFKFNFLASLRTHELQTSRAKIEGRPLPKLLELNAYGDCTKEEYLQLKEQESLNLVAPRSIVDVNATATATTTETSTANVTVTANLTATTPTTTTPPEPDEQTMTPEQTPKKAYSLSVDNRGPERERKATTFPQRSTNFTAAMTPLSPMTSKLPPTKSLQQQLDDLNRATSSLAPQPNISRKPPQFASVGTTSQLPKPSSSFLKPDAKGFPERSASYFPKRTNPPKLAAAKSDQETNQVTNVNPNPGSSHVPPDQRGVLGEKSATTFPKRTEAPATPKNAPKTEIGQTISTSPSPSNKDTTPVEQETKAETKDDSSNLADPLAAPENATDTTTSTLTQSTTPPPVAISDQGKQDVTKVQPDATKAKPTEEKTKKTPPTTTTSAFTPVLMPDNKDVPKLRTSTLLKQGQVTQKTGAGNANETPPRPSSSVKPDVFYREQSALSFPKRTEAHQARKVVTDSKSSETLSAPEAVALPKPETDGSSVTRETGPRPSTNPSGSFIKPDLFFQDRSAMKFPKRAEAQKSGLPRNTEPERKPSPSLSYIKADFPHQERSVTTFSQRPEVQFALVKAAMFRDDIVQTPPKTLLPDQRRANIADPFSFAKKKRDDLPPPDFEGQKETTTKLENTTAAEPSLPVANNVASAPVEPNRMISEPKKEESSEPKSEKPEVQVSVPDMTDIQLKLAKLQTKESKPAPKAVTTPVPEPSTPPLVTSKAEKGQPTTDITAPKVVEETKVQRLDDGLKQPKQKQAPKDTEEGSENISNEKAEDKSSLEAKKDDLLHQALLKERMNIEHKSLEHPESSVERVPPPGEINASRKQEAQVVKATKGEQSPKAVDNKDATTTKTVNKEDASVGVASNKQGSKKDTTIKADVKPAPTGSLQPPAEQSQAVDKSPSKNSKPMKSVNVPEIDPAARQKEIEEALKADFSAPETKSSYNASVSPPATPDNTKSVISGTDVDRVARQKEIEEALKAEFTAAASTTDRQQQIEAIFEGKVQVQAQRPAAPIYDPFAVGSSSSSSSSRNPKAPPASVEDILAEEMNAVKALKTNQGADPAIKAAEEVLKAPRTVSIHDILKAEMDAAKIMKKTSSEADVALSAPMSNGSLKEKDAPASNDKADLKTKAKGDSETTIGMEKETENTKGEETPQNKKRKRKKKNKNKGATIDAGVNGLSNTQINGQEKEP